MVVKTVQNTKVSIGLRSLAGQDPEQTGPYFVISN